MGEQHGLETVVARCLAFVGPDLPLNVHFAIGSFIPLRTYLAQSDLAHWLLTLLEQGRPGQAYNVGSDEVISIAALAHLVRDILAPDKPVHILGQPDPGAARSRYVPDIRKAQQQLGLSVRCPGGGHSPHWYFLSPERHLDKAMIANSLVDQIDSTPAAWTC